MIWQNPWAWLGLLTLAVPILVHLLARQRAPRQPFPSLRFLPHARLLTARRARPTDLLLLALRLLILLLAVAALAQPYLLTGERAAWQTRTVARAVVVDTSASMRGPLADGQAAVDAALAEGERLALAGGADAGQGAGAGPRPGAGAAGAAGAATTGLVIPTAAPGAVLDGAAAWLAGQPGMKELVVLSDFQRGALDSLDLAGVPEHVGLALRRVAGPVTLDPVVWTGVQGDLRLTARTTAAGDTTAVTWSWSGEPGAPVSGSVVLHGPGEAALAAAVRRAALASAPAGPDFPPLALVLPGYPGLEALLAEARPLEAPWMGDVVAALGRDAALAAAVEGAGRTVSTAAGTLTAVARTPDGEPAVLATRVPVEGTDHLALVVLVADDGITAAAALTAALQAGWPAAAVAEAEPVTLSSEWLERWARPAAPPPSAAAAVPPGASDGRWLWAVVLLLLGAETLLRRRTGTRPLAEEAP
ncbi:MAG: BatA domain-containing protein [Gemmatimonadota bacterium]